MHQVRELGPCEQRERSGRPRLPSGGHRLALHMPSPGRTRVSGAPCHAARGPGSGCLPPSLLLSWDRAVPGPTSLLTWGGGLNTSWFADKCLSAWPTGKPSSPGRYAPLPGCRRQCTRLGGWKGRGRKNTFLKYPPDKKDSAYDQDIPGRHPQTEAVLPTCPQKAGCPAPSPHPFPENKQPDGSFSIGHPSKQMPRSQTLGGGHLHCRPTAALSRGLGRNPGGSRQGPSLGESSIPLFRRRGIQSEHLTYCCLLALLGSELSQEVLCGQGLLFQPPGCAAWGACDPTVPNHVTPLCNTHGRGVPLPLPAS